MIADSTRPPGNLPPRLTRFIGQAEEVRRIAELLDEHAVVTITGPGGVGKTSAAIEVGRRLAEFFPDGVWFVNLAMLDEGAEVAPFASEILHDVAPLAHDAASFGSALADRRALLVLDSCEHVLAQARELVAAVAEFAPRSRIVATTRQSFDLECEIVHRLESLALDDAIELFVDRAANAGIGVSDAERPAIAAIVRRLDAIPLAIELAAPQLRSMAADELLRHVEDRLEVMALENSGAHSRQQTLEAMHDWSHRLLSENAQKLFRRLAIFVGGATLEAAMNVCADDEFNEARVGDALDELVSKSLVVVDDSHGRARYRMLETTRAYAQGRLFESNEYDDAAQAHIHFYMLLARRLEAVLEAMPALKWQSTVMVEAQNFRAAMSLALDAGDVESPAAICESLHNWLWTHGSIHASDITPRIAAVLGTPMEKGAEAALRLGYASLMRHTDRQRALDSAKRAWELYQELGDVTHGADALRCTDSLQFDLLGASTARMAVEVERYAGLMLEQGSTLRAAELLNQLGINYVEMLDEDRTHEATVCFERAAGLLEARGDRERAGRVIGNSAVIAYIVGDREQAVRRSRRAVEFFDQVPDSMEAGHQWNNLGFHLTSAGYYDEARDALLHAIRIACDRNDRPGLGEVLESAAQYHLDTGNHRMGARLLGCAAALMPHDLARQARETGVLQEMIDGLRDGLGDEAYEAEYRLGAAMQPDDIVREAPAAL